MGEENNAKPNSKFKSRTFWWGVGISLITVAGMVTGKMNWTEGVAVLATVFTGFKAFDTWEKKNNGIIKKTEEVK